MISFDPDEVALAFTAEHLGADKILWASDYPHPDAKIPGVVKELKEAVATLPPDAQAEVLGGSARRFYASDPQHLRDRSRMTPLVLVHGGGLDSRCWDVLLPHLTAPAIAVDLPGRGRHPAPLASVTFADSAQAVADDVDAAGFDEFVLVGHSLAGCSMPAVVGLLGARVRHAVFVACTVPADGTSCIDTLDPEVQAYGRAAGEASEPQAMNAEMAKLVLGDDLDDAQFAWCVERLVPEAPRLTLDRVDLSPFREHAAMSRTWVRTMHDIIVPAREAAAVRGQRRRLHDDRPRVRSHVHGRPTRRDRRHPQPDRGLTDSCVGVTPGGTVASRSRRPRRGARGARSARSRAGRGAGCSST